MIITTTFAPSHEYSKKLFKLTHPSRMLQILPTLILQTVTIVVTNVTGITIL